ncbi:MAG: TerB family tellurite resistance protein [Deltaproteobacteria bacterium]|nr:TerB family tellurite resistance protein [Deltaproteobacteria bacterium]
MADSQILSVIRMWAAIAWADGVLAESEAEGLRRLVRNAELTPEERETAGKLLEQKTVLDQTFLTDLTPDARRGIYRAACRMAIVDHVLATSERVLLDQLQGMLAVPAEVAREIEADVPGLIS